MEFCRPVFTSAIPGFLPRLVSETLKHDLALEAGSRINAKYSACAGWTHLIFLFMNLWIFKYVLKKMMYKFKTDIVINSKTSSSF